MRGDVHPSITLANVRVPGDAALGRPGCATQVGVVESFAFGYAAVYVGLAEAAFDFAVDCARKRIVKRENVPVARRSSATSAGCACTSTPRASCSKSPPRAWADADFAERGLLASRAKFLATEVGLEVTEKAIQVVGGRGAYRDFSAERAFRDLRTSTLMLPTVDRMVETIGKSALGIAEGMFRTEPRASSA